MKSEIFFIPVHDPSSKLKAIVKIATLQFKKLERLLILVADKTAQDFVDQLLWRFPDESFLPSCVTNEPRDDEFILISQKNILTPAVLNLCSVPCFTMAKIIYELEDFTSADKEKFSKERYQAYREAQHPISLLKL